MKPSSRILRTAIALLTLVLIIPEQARAGKHFLWVTNAYGDDVHVFSVPEHKLVERLVVGPEPHGIAAPADARVVFLTLEKFKQPAGELLWIDPRTYEIRHRLDVGPEPNQIACTPDGRWVYVPCKDGQYWVVDAEARRVVEKIRTGGRPHNTTCSPDGRRMYLSPMGSPRRVTIVDVPAGHKVVGEIRFSNAVRPPALTADGKRFFQHVDGLLGFEVADVPSGERIARVRHEIPEEYQAKASRCHGLAIRPDQKEIWSCNVEHHLVHVHDVTKPDYPEIAQIPMIGRIYWLCFSPDSKYAYVSVRSENKVAVVDCASKKVLTHLPVGDTPKRNLVITLP